MMEDLTDRFSRFQTEIATLVSEKESKDDELRWLKQSLRNHEDTIDSLRGEIANLRTANNVLHDDLRHRNSAEDTLARQEVELAKLHGTATQEEPIKAIGREVRLRFLESHKHRNSFRSYNHRRSKSEQQLSEDRMKAGNRAAHRGRPIPDAYLCVTGEMDAEVYIDLYGVDPEDMAPKDSSGAYPGKGWAEVPELVELTGFRASLRGEGKLSEDFKWDFRGLVKLAEKYNGTEQLRRAFVREKGLKEAHNKLTNYFDDTVSQNQPGKRTGKVGWN